MSNERYDDLDELPAAPRKDIAPADRELLELAARALGAEFREVDGEGYGNLYFEDGRIVYSWNSLQFSGDTFDLAADLGLQVFPVARSVSGQACAAVADVCGRRLAEDTSRDVRSATRRAVTRAAAEVGKQS